jgi:hypothetical protein
VVGVVLTWIRRELVGGSVCQFLIGPFKFKFDHLNINLIFLLFEVNK